MTQGNRHSTRLIDLTGQKFGMLTVEKRAANEGGHLAKTCWWCICDCGNKTVARTESLRSKMKISCGCVLKKYRDKKAESDKKISRWIISGPPKKAKT